MCHFYTEYILHKFLNLDKVFNERRIRKNELLHFVNQEGEKP